MSTGRMPLQMQGPQAPQKPVQFTDEQIAAIGAYVQSTSPGPSFPADTVLDGEGDVLRPGDRVDAVAVPGGGVVVRAVPVGRDDAPGSPTVISGSGTASVVPDPETATALGLGEAFPAAPGAVVGLLPAGPVLSVPDALTPLPAGG